MTDSIKELCEILKKLSDLELLFIGNEIFKNLLIRNKDIKNIIKNRDKLINKITKD